MNASEASILFSHHQHVLNIQDCDFELDVLAFEGQEHLSQPFSYRIELTSQDKKITRTDILMKTASLTLQGKVENSYGLRVMQPLRVVQGVVTGFEHLSTSVDEAHYAITISPRLALLSRTPYHAIYQDMSVPQIVESILRERHGMRGQDFEFVLERDYPRRMQVMQYGEDDLTFITRILSEVGIWFSFYTDTRLHIDVVAFHDSKKGYLGYQDEDKALTLPAVPPSGMNDVGVESIWDMRSRTHVVEKGVSLHDYYYQDSTASMDVDVSVGTDDPNTYGTVYHDAPHYQVAGEAQQAFPEVETGAFYAKLKHEQYLNQQTLLAGTTNYVGLTVGQSFQVTGNSLLEAFDKGVAVVSLRSRARRDAAFELTFEAIPVVAPYCYRPKPAPKPVMAGTIPARVSSSQQNDIYGHIDKHGRYKVQFLFDRASWPQGNESLWVRQSRQYAGDTYGFHMPLLVGTEVAIGFEHGDPDRPFIAGALHDDKHPDHVTIENYKRNVLRTPSNNKIRLDDTRDQEHIKFSTEYGGKSQLNLGHLVDSERQQRGEGFELRSDSWGAIRAGKGMFISADKQESAGGDVLNMDAALSELQAAEQITSGLNHAAQAAKAELADLEKQTELMQQKLTELKKEAILLSAPEGIAQVTPAHLQMSAGENVMVTAGDSAHMSVMKKFAVSVGETLSLFAHKMGIKLFAAKGAVDIQAQSDAMNLFSKQQMSIASSDDKTVITAKKEIVLNAGSSFIKLSDAGIEIGTGKNVTMRSLVVERLPKKTLSMPLPDMPVSDGMSDFFMNPLPIREPSTFEAEQCFPSVVYDGVFLWVEAKGVGHAFISIHDQGKVTIFTYGRYDDTYLGFLGDGVLIKLQDLPAQEYIVTELYELEARVFHISDVDKKAVYQYFNELWESSNELPDVSTRENTKKYGRVIDLYDVTGNNCTTYSVNALKFAGTKAFNTELLGINYSEDFTVPSSLQEYMLNIQKNTNWKYLSYEATNEMKEYFPNTLHKEPTNGTGIFGDISGQMGEASGVVGKSSGYAGGTTGGIVGSSND